MIPSRIRTSSAAGTTGPNATDAGADRTQALELLRRHGWNTTSFQILEPGFSLWFADDTACVAYLDTGRAWVAAGAPIAADDRLAQVAEDFCRQARAHGRRAVFFAIGRRFVEATNYDAIAIGEEPVWDPSHWRDTVVSTRSLRDQLRRARNAGVSVEIVSSAELDAMHGETRIEIEGLIARWLGEKHLPPMGFLVRVDPFSFVRERRAFVAKRDGEIVGFAGVIPVFARNGWFIKDLIRAPDAPNGTVELLVDAAMRNAAEQGSNHLTLGLSPLAGDVGFLLSSARKCGRAFYNFSGLRAFKAKFRPHEWAPVYVAHPPGGNSPLAIIDSLGAFARGDFFHFGIEALMRGPGIVLGRLASRLQQRR